jgi:DNA polymerase/3'-5' exonuclease PolX
MPLERAEKIAARMISYIDRACLRAEVAGSIRRRLPTVGDIEIVCVPNNDLSLELLFPEGFSGMTVNGPRLKRFVYHDSTQIELYITSPHDWGRIFAIRTGSSTFSHINLATQWNRLGWCGTHDGLRRKKECDKKSTWKLKPEFKMDPTLPPPFTTERKFFEFLKIAWVDPVGRSWKSEQNPSINYSN